MFGKGWVAETEKKKQENIYTIKIQNFEGPLDLLIHLIEKNKMDIYDIQINEITDQYMSYLAKMKELDLEIASEFLVMASTLLLIKSRMLLPEVNNKIEEEQDDLKKELINRLLEYKKYKEFAKELKEREIYYSKIFYRSHEIIKTIMDKKTIKINYSSELIPSIYRRICERNIKKINPNSTSIERILVREKVTIRTKIREILKKLIKKVKFKFSELFVDNKTTKFEKITAFLAILELAKVRRISIFQKKLFDEIIIKKLNGGLRKNGTKET